MGATKKVMYGGLVSSHTLPKLDVTGQRPINYQPIRNEHSSGLITGRFFLLLFTELTNLYRGHGQRPCDGFIVEK
jgi:hypothetical protein